MRYTIRDVDRDDERALGALERAAPDAGSLLVQVDLRLGYLELVGRHPGVRGYVAVADARGEIVGMLFSSIAPTQLNGRVVPGAYLFSLRVHPAARRRGIAGALIEHTWERARSDAHAEVAWAGIMAGNTPSLRTFARAGFTLVRNLAIRVVFPSLWPPSPARDSALMARIATRADLSTLADTLNRAHEAHNFWRRCTAKSLWTELVAACHSLEDVHLALDARSRIVSAAAVFDVGRVARLRLLGHSALPSRLNRILAYAARRFPIRPLVVRRPLLSDALPTVIRSIHQRSPPFAPVVLVGDPRDPGWVHAARLGGMNRRLHLVARSLATVDPRRPVHVE